jgi:hypothetical protein
MVNPGDVLCRVGTYNMDYAYDVMSVRDLLSGIKGSIISLGLKRSNGNMYDVELSRNVRSVKKTADAVLNKVYALHLHTVSNHL